MGSKSRVAVFEEPRLTALPLWREMFSGIDLVRLKTSLVYYGFGLPRGDKSPVVVVPGFLGFDLYLLELYFWLRRIGYTPYMSRIGHNAECPDILCRRLLKTVTRAHQDTGMKVHLVGHSLGGVLSRGVASQAPDKVASVITLGSPFRGVLVNPIIIRSMRFLRNHLRQHRKRRKDCFTPDCVCGFTTAMRNDFPTHIPTVSVYTKTDGVVDWHACLHGRAKLDEQVAGTHVGLAWNPEAYRIIAERLHAFSTLPEHAGHRNGNGRLAEGKKTPQSAKAS